MNIGVRIKRLRGANSWSQPELAYRLGISQTTLCNIESGKCKKIDFLLMVKVCQEFNITFDYFLKDKQVNKIGSNEERVVGYNNGEINNFPEDVITQIKLLIEDNKQKNAKVKELEQKLK
ncbi:helix-turn-helix domain-containing protein [Flavobacterium sp. WC2409]|uniref:Helix-turn-helix domain-containing protein n=1 Tax=Flavobacterium sp. WC2409 TaxID=3234139 RepID=A0AB39W251_9FLAO